MYALGSATGFAGFAVAADTTGLFARLGFAGPLLSALHFLVGALLVVWLVAFAYALAVIMIRRINPAPRPAVRPVLVTQEVPS